MRSLETVHSSPLSSRSPRSSALHTCAVPTHVHGSLSHSLLFHSHLSSPHYGLSNMVNYVINTRNEILYIDRIKKKKH